MRFLLVCSLPIKIRQLHPAAKGLRAVAGSLAEGGETIRRTW
jgi:hypothetical protein